MSAISYSAPYVSEKNSYEQNEATGTTEDERRAVQDDAYGRRRANNHRVIGGGNGEQRDGGNDNGGDDISQELLRNFHSVLEEQPEESAENLLHAMSEASDLVEAESNPSCFLRCVDYNPNLAAVRLCEYWNMRVEIFKECAFEPMTLEGAMKDIVRYMALIPNYIRILPNDDHGRTVICLDRTNLQYKDYDEAILIKFAWFVFHEALQRRTTQQNGVVMVYINQSSSWDFPSRNLLKLMARSMQEALPIKIWYRHVFFSSLVLLCVLPVIERFMPREARLRHRFHNSVILKNPTILNELKGYGLRSENLPTSIGGTYDEKPTWLSECKSILKEGSLRRRKRERR